MPGWTDLNAWMAACWNVVWNDDPLALSVPESFELPPVLPVEPPVGVLLVLVALLELHALVTASARTAVVTAAQRVLLPLMVVTVFSSP
jgi:hypothetical protein